MRKSLKSNNIEIVVFSMLWNGMEWNGMEWNGMEWYGMEWNGMEWNDGMRERDWLYKYGFGVSRCGSRRTRHGRTKTFS
jgi:hypothetical protein